MIPNSAPMAAVYLDPSATGSRDGRLFSNPVAAWDKNGHPMVAGFLGPLCRANDTRGQIEFLGVWQNGWSPSYDEMASLLPEHAPGTPHPLATRVTIRELSDGWAAYRTKDGRLLRKATVFNDLEKLLGAVGSFHIEKIVRLGDED